MVKKKQGEGMVDVSWKDATRRRAIAQARITLGKKAFQAFIKGGSPKGNVLETARLAGIMAAKSTPAVIPMCHPLELSKVKIEFNTDKKKYTVTATVEVVYLGRTGVEMEALVAASVSVLTIYDMMKWVDKGMRIDAVRLIHKSGGKSGIYNS